MLQRGTGTCLSGTMSLSRIMEISRSTSEAFLTSGNSTRTESASAVRVTECTGVRMLSAKCYAVRGRGAADAKRQGREGHQRRGWAQRPDATHKLDHFGYTGRGGMGVAGGYCRLAGGRGGWWLGARSSSLPSSTAARASFCCQVSFN